MLHAFHRYVALTRKEFSQLRANRKLIVQLIVPPTLMLVLWGYALNPEVKDLRTGIVDYDRTPQSRELIATMTEMGAVRITAHFDSSAEMERAFARRELDIAVVIPAEFSRSLARRSPVGVQLLIDAVVANSAAVAGGYLKQCAADYNLRRLERALAASPEHYRPPAGQAEVRAIALYNPGLRFAWFYLTAVMGIVLFLDGSLVAAAIAVREKEVGTLEQLLMSPAQSIEILLAKTTPVLTLLVTGLLVSMGGASVLFDLPLRGSAALFTLTGVLAGFTAMGLGILLAAFSDNQQQSQLLAFFINPFLVLSSGAFARVENMPEVLQWMSYLNPLRYFVQVIRGVTIRGVGVSELWEPLTVLAAMMLIVYGVSAWRFRKQLH